MICDPIINGIRSITPPLDAGGMGSKNALTQGAIDHNVKVVAIVRGFKYEIVTTEPNTKHPTRGPKTKHPETTEPDVAPDADAVDPAPGTVHPPFIGSFPGKIV